MKKCIYIVEDNAAIRDVIEFMLTEDEYDVVASPTASDFWKHMELRKPDMIVLDVRLPDGNGVDICNKLKSDVKTYSIPVMMMSANNYLNKVKWGCVAEEFINKPFDINDFSNRIAHHIIS